MATCAARVHRHGALKVEHRAVMAAVGDVHSDVHGLDFNEHAMIRRRRARWRTASRREGHARTLPRAAVALGATDEVRSPT